MSIMAMAFLLNYSLVVVVICATIAASLVILYWLRKVVYLCAIDVIEIRSRWKQANLDIKVKEEKFAILASMNDPKQLNER